MQVTDLTSEMQQWLDSLPQDPSLPQYERDRQEALRLFQDFCSQSLMQTL